MKNILTTIFLMLSLVSYSQESDSFTDRELVMVNEINGLRVNPLSYIPKIENYISMCNKKLRMVAEGGLVSNTNIKRQILAAEELIVLLKNTKPLNKLVANHDMYLVTKAHGKYLKSIKSSTHKSKNGDLAPERMINIKVNNITENIANDNGMVTPTIVMLLVDSGISSRGHRTNLLDPNAKFISVYTNGTTWIQNFAN